MSFFRCPLCCVLLDLSIHRRADRACRAMSTPVSFPAGFTLTLPLLAKQRERRARERVSAAAVSASTVTATPFSTLPNEALMVKCAYDGIEVTANGDAESGYLVVQSGSIVIRMCPDTFKGHGGNKYREYIWAERYTTDNDNKQQGWLPSDIVAPVKPTPSPHHPCHGTAVGTPAAIPSPTVSEGTQSQASTTDQRSVPVRQPFVPAGSPPPLPPPYPPPQRIAADVTQSQALGSDQRSVSALQTVGPAAPRSGFVSSVPGDRVCGPRSTDCWTRILDCEKQTALDNGIRALSTSTWSGLCLALPCL